MIVETVDDLPTGWGAVRDDRAPNGIYFWNELTRERSFERPGGPRRTCDCGELEGAPTGSDGKGSAPRRAEPPSLLLKSDAVEKTFARFECVPLHGPHLKCSPMYSPSR